MIKTIIGRLVFILGSCAVVVAAGGGSAFIERSVGVTYLALWVTWWVATFLGRRPGATSGYDRRTRPWVIVAGFVTVPLLIVGPPWEYAHFSGPIPRDGALAWVGLAAFATGIALQAAAMWALAGSYTVWLGVRPGQRLVTSGPYRFVRHPGYLSYILSLTGIGLALGSLIALALAVLVVPFLMWRIGTEERMLLAEFGDRYRDYMRRAKRLLPFVY